MSLALNNSIQSDDEPLKASMHATDAPPAPSEPQNDHNKPSLMTLPDEIKTRIFNAAAAITPRIYSFAINHPTHTRRWRAIITKRSNPYWKLALTCHEMWAISKSVKHSGYIILRIVDPMALYDCSFVAAHPMGPPNPDLLKPFPAFFDSVTSLHFEVNTALNYTSALKRYMRVLGQSTKLKDLSVLFCVVNRQGFQPSSAPMDSLMEEWPSYRVPMKVGILYHYLWAWLFEELPG